ncbi:MAG: hypothetical protein COB62_05960 [Piscirickettsiaceae bacterium]|nr:MAG: hypothetical protein COB62_05960 [Piscirickettsiaceae bacterium]
MKISQKRRKIGYTYSSLSGSLPFRKLKSIDFESTLERDLLISLEHDSTVLDVIEQPVTIEYINKNGREASYTPDFLVSYSIAYGESKAPCSKLIEVKPTEILCNDWESLKQKFKVGVAFAKENDYIFKIYNEARIHTKYFYNVRLIKMYRNYKPTRDVADQVYREIMLNDALSVQGLAEAFKKTNSSIDNLFKVVCYLLMVKVLECDMTHPLSETSLIWMKK